MGSKKGHGRGGDETDNVKRSKCSELLAQSRGSVDLNGREGKRIEKKRKLDYVDGKGHDDGCDRRLAEEEERSKEGEEKNMGEQKKRKKIDVDEHRSERGDADIVSCGSEIIQRKKEKRNKEKKIRNIEEPRDEKGHAGVELYGGKIEDIKKVERKKKRIAERHQPEREIVQVEQVEVEKGKVSKRKGKRDKMKGERQPEEKQNDEETDGVRKKRFVEFKHALRGTTPTTKVRSDNKCGDKGNGKEVGGNFNCSEDIEDTRESAENLETTGCKEGKHGREKNGRSNVESDETMPGKSASKKVTFAENDEVFAFRDSKQDVIVGKRYTKEEDELLKQAVHNYIESHGLGENGIEMVLCCRSHKQKGCWREISESLPWRSRKSIYYRAHTLFERAGEMPDWTPEELELILQHHKKYGPRWKQLAEVLGKYRYDVKNIFRIMNHGQLRRGKWTPEELDTLYELVNKDLRMSMNMEKKKTHQGIFRDNIAWTALSEQLGTRHFTTCCTKWYRIASPMVSQGLWNDSDDYRLVDALVSLDKCSFVEVDWDNLLEHRVGELCVRRWKELIRSVNRHYTKTFVELVEILSKRYAWEVLEAREAMAEMT